MSQRRRLVKLVRDRVGQFIGSNQSVDYAPVPQDEHRRLLRAKLAEECTEYLLSPSIGELADVYAAVKALANIDLGVPFKEIENEARAKERERGGFLSGTGMYVTTTAPPRHEGEHRG